MAQFRPFAITQTPLSLPAGTTGVGNIVIGVDQNDYYNNYGTLQWIAGPDESTGIIIAYHDTINPLHAHSSTPGNLYNIGFLRAANEAEFIKITEDLSVTENFGNASEAKIWLNNNGYWTSYNESPWAYGNISTPPTTGWYFYSDEGPMNAGAPTSSGNAIFFEPLTDIETYNPNQNPSVDRYLLFNRYDSANTDFNPNFTALQNGGIIVITQIFGGNTNTATYTGGGAGFNYNGAWLSIATHILTQTASPDGPFVYGEPITLAFS